MMTARALLTGSGRAACGDRLVLPGETTDGDEDHHHSLRERGEGMADTGRKVYISNTTVALLVQAALDPAMARRATKGDGVLCCDHCGLLHTARQ